VESGPSGAVSAEPDDDSAVEAAEETGPPELNIHITGYQFGWEFRYPNGHTELNTLRVPNSTLVRLSVTSRDVWHNFGVPAFRVKSDAIPGETTKTWFIADNTGEYTANCYELCGVGHSQMTATVVVMEPEAYDSWYNNTDPEPTPTPTPEGGEHGSGGDGDGGGHGG